MNNATFNHMLQDSRIKLEEKHLIISLTPFGAGRKALFELFGVLLTFFIVHPFATSELADTNPQMKLVYLGPIVIVFDLFKRIKVLITGHRYHFDKQLNELYLNDKRLCRLDNIRTVEINYKIQTDSDEMYLELNIENANPIRIRDFGSKNSMIKDGRVIAKFLKIKMIDNFPHDEEILWGDADVDSSSISHLNEHMRNSN